MTLADRTIASLRTLHDQLAATAASLTDEQLTGPSGASEWSVAQVLSHLGSGAEIGLAGYRVALDGAAEPGEDFNRSVWDRWDAATPHQQAEWFVDSDLALVSTLEALDAQQRAEVQIKLGFLPAPLPLASTAGMRLNEVALHAWDVAVALDPSAGIDPEAAAVLAEHFSTGIGFLLGFVGKADALAHPAVVAIEGTDFAISIGDTVSLVQGADSPSATFHGPLESAVRLLGGRLTPEYTPAEVRVSGAVTLDDLRGVFPGY